MREPSSGPMEHVCPDTPNEKEISQGNGSIAEEGENRRLETLISIQGLRQGEGESNKKIAADTDN